MKQKWIPVTKKMPPVETEVFITARRKYKDGTCAEIVTTAMYEDGTVLENDSCWHRNDINGKWDEENDCCIIPEGWWEYRYYNPDDVYNNPVDDEVIAWMPLPEPYRVGTKNARTEKPQTNADRIRSMTDEELAAFLCNITSNDEGCDSCFAWKYCQKGHIGIEDWLRAESEE